MKKIIGNILFYGIVISSIGAAVAFMFSDKKDKSILGYRFYEVLSGSMSPEIEKGDMVIVQMDTPEHIVPGDIVTLAIAADKDGVTLTHRVKKLYEEGGELLVVTKGDKNEMPDDPVPASNIIGRVKLRIPYLGLITGYIKMYIVHIITFAAALFIIYKIIVIMKKRNTDNESLNPEQGGGNTNE